MRALGMKSRVALQFRFLPEEYGQGLNCSMGNYNNGGFSLFVLFGFGLNYYRTDLFAAITVHNLG